MELGKQIKKQRMAKQMSQEQLAQRVYVSRQTVSNWENDKTYPDINSLVLLSEIFEISIDSLIKGDLKIMEKQIEAEEMKKFKSLGAVYSALFMIVIISPIPLCYFLGWAGFVIWIVIWAAAMFLALKVEKEKKKFDIQTYKEITAFVEGETLDEIAKAREEGKRIYQKVFLAMLSGAIALLFCVIFGIILEI